MLQSLLSAQKIIYPENKSYKKGFDKIKEAVFNNEVLKISLTKKSSKITEELEFHPHFLKMWKNKWYAFGYSPGSKHKPYVLPIDTLIKKIKSINKKHVKSEFSYIDLNGNSSF